MSWAYAGRLRSEAAFAALAGTNPDPCLVGTGHAPPVEPIRGPPTQRRLHTIALTRLRYDPETRAYAARRAIQGKTYRDVKWCLKRSIARQLVEFLERYDQPGMEILRAA